LRGPVILAVLALLFTDQLFISTYQTQMQVELAKEAYKISA